MDEKPHIAILEDHPVFRLGLKLILAPHYDVVAEADTATVFFEQLRNKQVHLVFLDIMLPDLNGVEIARMLKSNFPDIKILVFSIDLRDDTLKQLIEIGVDGFISKNSDETKILEAVSTILNGQNFFVRPNSVIERDVLAAGQPLLYSKLTEREQAIMMAFCKGLSSTEIASQLFISHRTVENHKQHIFEKLGIHNIVELVTYAIKNKIIMLN